MAHEFGSLVFTPAVQALQTRYGSRRQYAAMAESGPKSPGLGPQEAEFIAERDSFYMATVGATGWPYVQHRGGPKGFLKVIDARTTAFADFRGNKQFVSAGNLATDDRVALILVDYPRQTRLKVLGRAETSRERRVRSGSSGSVTPDTRRSSSGCSWFGWKPSIGTVSNTSPRDSPLGKSKRSWRRPKRRMQELTEENQRLREEVGSPQRDEGRGGRLPRRHGPGGGEARTRTGKS